MKITFIFAVNMILLDLREFTFIMMEVHHFYGRIYISRWFLKYFSEDKTCHDKITVEIFTFKSHSF